MQDHRDGRYYESGRKVFKAPHKTATGITMGFAVCVLCDGVDLDGAREIAEALNEKDARSRASAAVIANREEHEA